MLEPSAKLSKPFQPNDAYAGIPKAPDMHIRSGVEYSYQYP